MIGLKRFATGVELDETAQARTSALLADSAGAPPVRRNLTPLRQAGRVNAGMHALLGLLVAAYVFLCVGAALHSLLLAFCTLTLMVVLSAPYLFARRPGGVSK